MGYRNDPQIVNELILLHSKYSKYRYKEINGLGHDQSELNEINHSLLILIDDTSTKAERRKTRKDESQLNIKTLKRKRGGSFVFVVVIFVLCATAQYLKLPELCDIILGVLVFGVVVFIIYEIIQARKEGRRYKVGYKHFREKNWREAITEFDQYLGSSPLTYVPDAYVFKGLSLIELGEKKDGIEHLTKALEYIDSKQYSATKQYLSNIYYNRGLAFSTTGNYENAKVDFEQSVKLHYKYITLKRLMFAYYKLEEDEKALETFDTLLTEARNHREWEFILNMKNEILERSNDNVDDT